MAECRRRGLYQPSMKSKIAMRASAWERNDRRSMSLRTLLTRQTVLPATLVEIRLVHPVLCQNSALL